MNSVDVGYELLYILAICDREYHSKEVKSIKSFLAAHISEHHKVDIVKIHNDVALLSTEGKLTRLISLATHFKEKRDKQIKMIKFALNLIIIDTKVTDEERARFKILGAFWNIEVETYIQNRLGKKNKLVIRDELQKEIISLYEHDNSYNQISSKMKDKYSEYFSKDEINTIMLQKWNTRPLEKIYPFMFLDTIQYNIKDDDRYIPKTLYIVFGIRVDGRKEILGLYLNETEDTKSWLEVLKNLKNRGVKDILTVSIGEFIDEFKGLITNINSLYPKTEVQLCIAYQVSDNLRCIDTVDKKEFTGDLEKIYQVSNKKEAEIQLDKLEEKWGKKYPEVFTSLRDKWNNLSVYLKYKANMRKVIYTTKIIESTYPKFKTFIKLKDTFSNDDCLLKLFFEETKNTEKNWKEPIENWDTIVSEFSNEFRKRLNIVFD